MIITFKLVPGVTVFILSQYDAVEAFAPRRSTNQALFSSVQSCNAFGLTRLFSSSKWDNLIDEDDEGPPIPPDMKYVERNVMRQHENFVAIREAGGKEMTNDIYVREPGSGIYWFAGKVARVSDVSLEDAVARQWPLIEQHAANLRPIELYPHRGRLEIWTAPGDSELEVAYNRPSVIFQKMNRQGSGTKIKNVLVGFQGEVYQPGEEGFRTWRTEDGLPANPETNAERETRAPTDEEMAELEKKLEGQDLNALYEEQERRQGKDASL